MALTITHEPGIIEPAFNPKVHRVYSDINSATGFKYVFRIYKDTTLVSTVKVQPDPSGYGLCDASKVLRNYITRTLQPAITTTAAGTGQVVRYKVELAEEAQGGIVTAVTNQATVVTLAIYNNTTSALNGKQLESLTLTGLTLSHAGPYWIKHDTGLYKLYRDSAMTLPVTATGTFSANGFVQTTDAAIATSTKTGQTTAEKLLVDAVRDYDAYLDWASADDYLMQDSTVKKFLTNSSREKDISRTEYETLSALQNYAKNLLQFEVLGYDAAGTLLGSHLITVGQDISYSASVFTNPQNLKIDVGVGYMNLYDADPTNVTTDSDCAYYTVTPFDDDGFQAGESFRFNITEPCDKYETLRLMWLNPLGGWDYYTFKATENRSRIQRSTYKKVLGYDYTKKDRGDTVYHAQADKFWTATSGWLTQTEADWMYDLFMSAEVYIVDSVGDSYPVTVTNEEYTSKVQGRDKLKLYTIELRSAHKNTSNA